MKKYFLILCLIPLSLIAQDNVKIHGTLPAKTGTVTLSVDRSFLNKKIETVERKVTEGSYAISTKTNRTRIMQLSSPYFTISVFVQPGTDLTIDVVNNDNNPTINVTGNGASDNLFIQRFFGKFSAYYSDSINKNQILHSSIDQYETFLFKTKKEQLDFLKNDSARSLLSASFVLFIENEINYNYWKELFSFPIINANSDVKILTVTPLPDLMLDNFNSVKIDNDVALINESYRDFIKYYVTYATSKNNGFKKFTDFSTSADRKTAIAKTFLSGSVFVYWLSRFTIEDCERMSPFTVKRLLGMIKENDSEHIYSSIANDVCGARQNATVDSNDTKENVAGKSKSSNELLLTDSTGKKVSLSDFKGKVVYIDFWASWCGPCRAMMPSSKGLHESLSEKQKKQIVFLYISIDGDLNNWKKGIRDMQIQGANAISPGNWSSPACSYFQINSIPRYMIMNKKGDIVELNAPRPNDPTLLNKLIKLAE